MPKNELEKILDNTPAKSYREKVKQIDKEKDGAVRQILQVTQEEQQRKF